MKTTILTLAVSGGAILSEAPQASAESNIEYTAPNGAYPEGIAYDALTESFFVSSMQHGSIGKIDKNGVYSLFLSDPRLISTFGMKVDPTRRRLLVTNADPGVSVGTSSSTQGKLAQLVEISLDNGTISRVFELGGLASGPRFPNDLAVSPDGTAFVTDVLSPSIIRVDVTGMSSVLLQSDLFVDPDDVQAPGGLSPHNNGIVYHPDGFLLVGDYSRGWLWRIPVASPELIQQVRLATPLSGPDGLLLATPNELVVVHSAPIEGQLTAGVSRLVSDDGWVSASVAKSTALDGPSAPTTVSEGPDDTEWLVLSHYLDLFAADPKAAARTRFSIEQIDH